MWNEINECTFSYLSERSISKQEFDRKIQVFMISYFIENEIPIILRDKKDENFETMINIITIYNLTDKYLNFIVEGLLYDWHRQHETLAAIIQEHKAKGLIFVVDQVVNNPLRYLTDSETDWYGFIRRLFFALGDINSLDSKVKLVNFAHHKDEMIAKWAKEQLDRIDKF